MILRNKTDDNQMLVDESSVPGRVKILAFHSFEGTTTLLLSPYFLFYQSTSTSTKQKVTRSAQIKMLAREGDRLRATVKEQKEPFLPLRKYHYTADIAVLSPYFLFCQSTST